MEKSRLFYPNLQHLEVKITAKASVFTPYQAGYVGKKNLDTAIFSVEGSTHKKLRYSSSKKVLLHELDLGANRFDRLIGTNHSQLRSWEHVSFAS
jgi:hypothetical protein